MQEANSFCCFFSKINWACAVTLNPFVGFGRQLYTNIFENGYWLINIFVRRCAWWGNAENGVGGKEMEFFLLNGIKWSKCILMESLYIWLSIFINNETLRIIWKFDLSLRGVLGRIYALIMEVLVDDKYHNQTQTWHVTIIHQNQDLAQTKQMGSTKIRKQRIHQTKAWWTTSDKRSLFHFCTISLQVLWCIHWVREPLCEPNFLCILV